MSEPSATSRSLWGRWSDVQELHDDQLKIPFGATALPLHIVEDGIRWGGRLHRWCEIESVGLRHRSVYDGHVVQRPRLCLEVRVRGNSLAFRYASDRAERLQTRVLEAHLLDFTHVDVDLARVDVPVCFRPPDAEASLDSLVLQLHRVVPFNWLARAAATILATLLLVALPVSTAMAELFGVELGVALLGVLVGSIGLWVVDEMLWGWLRMATSRNITTRLELRRHELVVEDWRVSWARLLEARVDGGDIVLHTADDEVLRLVDVTVDHPEDLDWLVRVVTEHVSHLDLEDESRAEVELKAEAGGLLEKGRIK